ncbi:UbiA prenyltransferase family-domain-containing protein [Chytriomyces cf. hyalinus JEL632]|nr:UbiA prenyltransferase family-domain-containing protein [Chytriomyces cf. hyalinus JEL632]
MFVRTVSALRPCAFAPVKPFKLTHPFPLSGARSRLLSSSQLVRTSKPTTSTLPFHPPKQQSSDPTTSSIHKSSEKLDSYLDDSSIDALRWKAPPTGSFVNQFLELSKARLAALVVLTTMAGYAMAPMAVSLPILLATTTGTALCVSSANALNQWSEAPFDAQMKRTKSRLLVTHAMSGPQAVAIGVASGVAGVAALYTLVNPLTAALGLANIVLYAGVYTPMKRFTIWNTWVGALVGAIPPIMGWVACTGSLDAGALVMGSILFCWQFPHFNALSWNLRQDYAKAGYHMMSAVDPALNARVSLRYALALFPVSALAPYLGMTSWMFLGASSVVNGAFLVCAVRFWRDSSDKSARELFFMSLIHLPVLLGLLMVFKEKN